MITIPDQIRSRLAGISFIDLCCGAIGGFGVALKSCGATCVYAADISYDTVCERSLFVSEHGVAQARRRFFLLAFRRDLNVGRFCFPPPLTQPVSLRDCLLPPSQTSKFIFDLKGQELRIDRDLANRRIEPVHDLIRIGHFGGGKGGRVVYHVDEHAATITRRPGHRPCNTGHYWVDGVIRRLAPREAARCFGLPDSFKLHERDDKAVEQLGNSVVVNVVQRIVVAMVEQGIFGGAGGRS